MNNEYPSFVVDPKLGYVDYPCEDLHNQGYKLKVSCDINNPDCHKYIIDRQNEGCDVKVIKKNPDDNDSSIVHLWILYK